MLLVATGLDAQPMYRCTAPDGSLAFQDKPCPPGARQSVSGSAPIPATTGPIRLRPLPTLLGPQRAEYEALVVRYVEVFRIVGRARQCNNPGAAQRFDELGKAMEERHGKHDDILMTMLVGVANGMENRPPVSCELNAGELAGARLPDVPRSLTLEPGEPVDYVLRESRVSTVPYRVVKRTPAHGGANETVVLYDDTVVFRSALELRKEHLIEGPVPVLIIATVDPARRCRNGERHVSWHAVTLPSERRSRASQLDADCREVVAYHRGAGFKRPEACIDMGPQPNRRYFAVDDWGGVFPTTEPAPGACR